VFFVVILAWKSGGGFAFGAEVHDTVRAGDLNQVQVLPTGNPSLVSSYDDKGGPVAGEPARKALNRLRGA
jgi:hypothetical protein